MTTMRSQIAQRDRDRDGEREEERRVQLSGWAAHP